MHQIYRRIIDMAALMHGCYVLLFWIMGIGWMAAYNIGSVAFYCMMHLLVNRDQDRVVVALVHGEVCLFVILAVASVGWAMGFQMLLISVSTMVYFCPYQNKHIPYLFSLIECALFIGLYLYAAVTDALQRMHLGVFGVRAIYLINTCCSFGVILYAAQLSNLSARATKNQLLDENASLEVQATHDSLTGLWLRRGAEEHLAGMWKQWEKGIPFAVAMGDIDNFKSVNDTYGHACGDYVLKTIAELFSHGTEMCSSACRWGGEEFLLFFRDCRREEAAAMVEKLRRAVEEIHFIWGKEHLRLTVSFGVSDCWETSSLKGMLELADKRLYIGKNSGKNQVVDVSD